jgi:alkylated DNA nucleotide flippase Atl1
MRTKFKSRTPWREKLEKHEAKLVEIPPRMQKRFGTGMMLIPAPIDVDSVIRTVPRGRLVTQSQIRAKLATDCRAKVACPMTTGIFVRIAAEAAEEDKRNGKSLVTPYWRVIKDDGSLNEKFPGGTKLQASYLEQEGHQLRKSKGRPMVVDFDKYLVPL